jgi:hypothetical protein
VTEQQIKDSTAEQALPTQVLGHQAVVAVALVQLAVIQLRAAAALVVLVFLRLLQEPQ